MDDPETLNPQGEHTNSAPDLNCPTWELYLLLSLSVRNFGNRNDCLFKKHI